MDRVATNEMSEQRALLTDTERRILSGEKEVKDNYRYSVESRVRTRLRDRFPDDVELLRENQPEIFEILEGTVCEDDTAESDSSKDAVEEGDHTDIEAKEDVYDDLEERVEPDEETRAAEDVLRDLDLPGGGSKYEDRVNAVTTFYEFLRNHHGERVSKSDLKELAEDTDLDLGYASFTSLWNNWVKSNTSQGRDFNTLAQLPGVEMDGDDYVYRGANDE